MWDGVIGLLRMGKQSCTCGCHYIEDQRRRMKCQISHCALEILKSYQFYSNSFDLPCFVWFFSILKKFSQWIHLLRFWFFLLVILSLQLIRLYYFWFKMSNFWHHVRSIMIIPMNWYYNSFHVHTGLHGNVRLLITALISDRTNIKHI